MNVNDDKNLIFEHLEKIILLRMVFSIISLIACLIIILLYFLLLYQVKCSKNPNKKDQDNRNTMTETIGSTKTNKIGLGSHYMFWLVLSNFFSSLVEGSFYLKLYSSDKKETKNKDYYIKFSKSHYCEGYAFFHNFFELCGICWTTMITKLFYQSTKIERTVSQKKQMTKSFTYSFLSSFIISILPIAFRGGYGFAYTHCSFVKEEFLEEKKKEYYYTLAFIFGTILTVFIGVNFLFNIYALFKSYSYYKKKIKQLKDQNESEYSSLKIYVYLFFIFPIILSITRFLKLCQFGVDILKEESLNDIELILIYINSILYCLTGTFDSGFCIFFFRGVYRTCCDKNENELLDSLESNSISIVHSESKDFNDSNE